MSLVSRMAAVASRPKLNISQPKPLPAPIGGLVTSQNIGAMEPGTAIVLNNWFPTRKGIRVRGGNLKYATLSLAPEPVESMMAYIGLTRELFGASGGSIYPLTSVADPNVPPTADVTGQTSDYYSFVNFATTGGYFMPVVNGTDEQQLYDGTTWTQINGTSVPAITGADTSTFTHVNAYRNRLYYASGLNLYYLPVDSIGGAVGVLSMAGNFPKGGAILFSATWSSESGAASMQSYLVVMSTEGEAAVFTGASPASPDWALVNVYDISKPRGKNGWFRAGGDIIIATEQGLVPISAARYKDPSALGMDAISVKIEPTWKREAQSRQSLPWEIAKWDEMDGYYVNVPVTDDSQSPMTIVGNLKTGAISTYSGWDNRCFAIHNGQMYFGCNDGTVRLAEVGGTDNGSAYIAQAAFAWDHLGSPGFNKSMDQMKARFLTARPFSVRLSASVDYIQEFPVAPNALPDPTGASLWGVGLWGQAQWGQGETVYTYETLLRSIGRTGEVFSPEIQVPVNGINTPNIELVIAYYTTEQGEFGV